MTVPLKRIHSDVCGPFPESATGNRYFVSFIDEWSRWAMIYPMKTRDQVLARFQEFRNMIELLVPNDERIRALRTDNAKEYCSQEFEQFLRENNIHHELSTPYRQHQNGIAERFNRTIQEMTKTLMTHANLPKGYWEEASKTAAYLRNRCVTSKHEMTPHEALLGSKPDVSNLRTWGCRAYAVIPEELRRKLTDRSVEAILVGYAEKQKAYRLVNLKTRRLFLSKDVRFNENILGYENDSEAHIDENEMILKEYKIDENTLGTNETKESMINQQEEDDCKNDEQRRSARVRAQPARYFEEYANLLDSEPLTREEAISSPAAKQWESAMKDEYDSLMKNNTWTLTELPIGRKVIGTKWVFKLKRDDDGNPTRYKARLVAQGFRQVPGLDFQETFAPVMSTTSLRILLSHAAHKNLEIHQMDVETAYLNGTIDEEIYVKQPSGFEVYGHEDKVYRLNKAIYGLRQSGRAWWLTISKFLKDLGFSCLTSDPCVFRMKVKDDAITIGIYVDDLILISRDQSTVSIIKGKLNQRFRMKDLGDVAFLLGMKIVRDRDARTIDISQRAFVERILDQFGMTEAKPVSTPMPVKNYLEKAGNEEIETRFPYRQAVGALMYAAVTTRPDIMAAVTNVARFCSKPTNNHTDALKRILRYLRGTTSIGIKLGGMDEPTLEAYADSDWGNDPNDRRSTTGFILLYGGPISWKTRRQPTVALSSTEAEYMALASAVQETTWTRTFLAEIQLQQSAPTIVHQDNQGAIAIAHNVTTSRRSKHIDIRHHYLREKIADSTVKLKYCPTAEMKADILTKALGPIIFQRLRDSLSSGSVETCVVAPAIATLEC